MLISWHVKPRNHAAWVAFNLAGTKEKEQRLRLVFATHEVMVRGHSLRRIETAMQRMELSHLACLPGSYRSLLADEQPFVREIAVQEVKEAASAQEGSPN